VDYNLDAMEVCFLLLLPAAAAACGCCCLRLLLQLLLLSLPWGRDGADAAGLCAAAVVLHSPEVCLHGC
jgi:hypothetical protein